MTGERLRSFVNKLLERLTEPPPDDFPLSLSVRSESSPHTPSATLLVTVLVILCAIPRVLMMWRIDAVCNDGYYYISIADLLGRGEFDGAFQYLNLNLYPAVLLLLHKLGADWVTVAQLWGVLISTLVVIPLYGWILLAFNQRVAIVSCFLYIIHPEMIEISAEPIREPTFWFFFNCCLYFGWRSVSCLTWWTFVASGTTLVLASYTRSEGWLLLLPILLWPVLCRTGSWMVRFRLAAGTCLSLTVIPVLLVAVNVTMLRDHDRWEWGRFRNFHNSWEWLTTQVSPPVGPASTDQNPVTQFPKDERLSKTTDRTINRGIRNVLAAQIQPAAISTSITHFSTLAFQQLNGPKNAVATAKAAATVEGERLKQTSQSTEASYLWHSRAYLTDLVDSLGLPACIFLLIGLIGWRSLLLRRECIVFLLIGACVYLGVWIKHWLNDGINGRYFFTGWFVLAPFASLGFLTCVHRISLLRRPGFLPRQGRTTAGIFVVVMTLVSCGDAITSSHKGRQRQATLGRWLNAEYGPFEGVLVDNLAARIGYHAIETIPEVCHDHSQLAQLLNQQNPALVVLSQDFFNTVGYSNMTQYVQSKTVHRLPSSVLPNDRFVIFVRTERYSDLTQAASENDRMRQ